MRLKRLGSAISVIVLFLFTTAALAEDAKPAAPPSTTAQRYGTWGVDLDGMDRSVKPGDDFFKYVNGKWAATTQIPADKTAYGAFAVLGDLSEARVHALLDRWAADKSLKPGSDEAKVAMIYRSFLDEATAEKLDVKPIQPHLDAVKKAQTHEDLARLMGGTARRFGSSFFNAGIGDDAKNPDKYVLYVGQSGLGLADREFYLRDKFKPQKERYQKYVADMLRLIGWEEPEKNAADIVTLETQIADAHWTRSDSRDRDKTYNPTTVAELETSAPGFPWIIAFKEAGFDKSTRAVVRQNTALPKEAKIFADAPVATLKAWEAFHIADDTAQLLSKRFVDLHWEFRSKFLNGTTEQRARWKRAVAASEQSMGEAIGRTYVAEYFPPESKAKMEQLVAGLRAAMKGRIEQLQWMGPDTKAKALEKLSKFTVKIGYPSKWRDYSGLQISEGDLVGNAERTAKFEWARDLDRLNKPVDKLEWGMTPQTVNAYYQATKNEVVFPAAILQPPFFDPKADMAVNYGGIGAVIGHEITHGFDDQGRKSDGTGMLRDWWSADDAAKFNAQAAKYGAQYEAINFPQLPGLHIIGGTTMGENIGDLGGILMALDAYHLSLHGQPAPVIDGFTGDQRVFLGWAQVWRTLMRDDALRQLIMTNPHSPGAVRAFAPLRNVDAWYAAFGVKEGDAEYIKPEDRVRIW
jgi:putative endopeptidase